MVLVIKIEYFSFLEKKKMERISTKSIKLWKIGTVVARNHDLPSKIYYKYCYEWDIPKSNNPPCFIRRSTRHNNLPCTVGYTGRKTYFVKNNVGIYITKILTIKGIYLKFDY